MSNFNGVLSTRDDLANDISYKMGEHFDDSDTLDRVSREVAEYLMRSGWVQGTIYEAVEETSDDA